MFPFFGLARFSEYIITSLSKSHSTQMGGLGLNYLKLMTSPCGANPSATRRNEKFKMFVKSLLMVVLRSLQKHEENPSNYCMLRLEEQMDMMEQM